MPIESLLSHGTLNLTKIWPLFVKWFTMDLPTSANKSNVSDFPDFTQFL